MRLVEPLTRNVPWTSVAVGQRGEQQGEAAKSHKRTIFLEIEATAGGEERTRGRRSDEPFCDDDRNVAPDIEIAIGICCGYLDAGVTQALFERFSEDWMIGGVKCWPRG